MMDPDIRERFDLMKTASVTWDPERGGKLPLIHWRDHKVADLGLDPDGSRFDKICKLMLSGNYYPPEVIKFFGRFQDEQRDLRAGDRVLQRFLFLNIPIWSMVEIILAERGEDECRIGYVTTRHHHGRGIWQAHLTRKEGRLSIEVRSTSGPQSLLFWIGLPIARAIQLYARKKAIERFQKL